MLEKMFSAIAFASVLTQLEPKTRAERTGYRETSTYADVIQFLETIQSQNSKTASLKFIGKSFEGRPIPLMTVASPMVKDADQAKKTGKLIIYVQANIHAGEVEGKEAALHMLRGWVKDEELLKKAILLVQPIYNSDGNEKFGPQERNRPGQNGPELVGLRPNGQNFDLNRDCVKAESPEMQAALNSVYSWSPNVVFDLHTTDGTRHGYPLTYGGPNHPNTPQLIQDYTFEKLFPTVRKNLRNQYKLEVFDYGNGVKDKDQWKFETFAGEPRYVTNYGGLRNAITILSEAMVYEPFENRVRDTERFVKECFKQILNDAKWVKSITRQKLSREVSIGSKKEERWATTYQLKQRGIEDVLLEKDLGKGGRRSGPIRDIEAIKMPVFDRFEAKTTERVPQGYVCINEPKIVNLLKLHGIQFENLDRRALKNVRFEVFTINEFKQAVSAFQGHKLITMKGDWNSAKVDHGPNNILIKVDQPLGRLVFDLFEPACEDGLTAWGFFGENYKASEQHPVTRFFSN